MSPQWSRPPLRRLWLIAGPMVGALVLAACSSGPTINPITIGKSDKLCVDISAFQSQAAALEAASTSGNLTDVQREASATHQALVGLQKDAATLPDKVGGHLVRDDLATATATYASLVQALNAANPSDPNALSKALSSVQNSEGQAFTAATGRLDAYTKKVCGLSAATTTTTVPGATTTVVPVGPTGATTGPGPTSGPAASGPETTAGAPTTAVGSTTAP